MLNDLFTTAQKWLSFFKTTLHQITLVQLVEIAIVTLIASALLLYLSKVLIYFFKYTIELAKTLLKIVSILIVALLILLILRAIFDPGRVCRFQIESYITRCRPTGVGFIPPESRRPPTIDRRF